MGVLNAEGKGVQKEIHSRANVVSGGLGMKRE